MVGSDKLPKGRRILKLLRYTWFQGILLPECSYEIYFYSVSSFSLSRKCCRRWCPFYFPQSNSGVEGAYNSFPGYFSQIPMSKRGLRIICESFLVSVLGWVKQTFVT